MKRFSRERSKPAELIYLISLGQGQGVTAEAAINNAVKSGAWVIL